jgi:hypothetical protein
MNHQASHLMGKWLFMQLVKVNRGLLAIMSTDGRFRMNLPSEQGEVREPAWAPNKFY